MGQDLKKYRKLFAKLKTPQPPADLAHKTILAIAARERRILMAKLVGLGVLFASSLAIVITEFSTTGVQMGQSGFFEFGSLFFSDFGAALTNFPEIFLSMLESFPIFSAGLAIGALVVAIWSFIGFVDDANMLRANRSLSLK